MPLKPGSDRKTISENIREFHHGQTYERTKRKYGKRVADRQAVAASLSNARKGKRGKKGRKSWRATTSKRHNQRRRKTRRDR